MLNVFSVGNMNTFVKLDSNCVRWYVRLVLFDLFRFHLLISTHAQTRSLESQRCDRFEFGFALFVQTKQNTRFTNWLFQPCTLPKRQTQLTILPVIYSII